MSRTKAKIAERFWALLLSVLMVFTMIPTTALQVNAATTNYPDSYTVAVSDGENPIEGATVQLFNDDISLDLSDLTDENGVADFEMTKIADVLGAAGLGSSTITVNVSKDGYETNESTKGISATEAYHIDMTLTAIAVEQKTVSVSVSGDATVEVNGVVQNSATVDVGTEVPIKITPAVGCYIQTLSVAGETVEVTKGEAYEGTIKADTDVAIIATVVEEVKEVTITANVAEGGDLLIDDEVAGSKTIESGSEVKITAKASEGYQIASLDIGGAILADAYGETEFSANIVVSRDIKVTVTYVKVYTVTVTCNGSGNIEITEPETAGGTVTVETGSTVKIKATPEENYRVSEVMINDVVDEEGVSGANGSGYEKTLTADQDYTITVTFAHNVFNVSVGESDHGTATVSGNDAVEYSDSAQIIISPDPDYTVKEVSVVDAATNDPVSFSDITKTNDVISFNIEDITADLIVSVSFKETAAAEKNDLSIDDIADLRTDEDNLCVIKEGTSIVFSTEKNGIRVYDNETLLGGDETTQSVSVGVSATITKVELYYQAADEYYADWHVVMMDDISIVVDKGDNDNVTASLVAIPAANDEGYHNSNVTFKVNAEDTGVYSGLKLVEYWISCNDIKGEPIPLYTHITDIENTFEDTTNLVVDASVYNSKDVKVILHVIDRAGNEKTVEQGLMINSSKPAVSLDIDGTQYDNAMDGYYNSERVLSITIVDRNDTFSEDNAAAGLKIKKDGTEISVAPSDIEWTTDAESDSVHYGKYTFAEDAHYEWEFSYTNRAGLSNEGVTAPTDKDIFDFYVDKAAPHSLKVTYEPEFTDVVLEAITFGFYQATATVTIEATDNTAGIEQFVYSYVVDSNVSSINVGKDATIIPSEEIIRDGNTAKATFEIPAQFRGKVSFSAIDRAGRTTEWTEEKTVVVDTIAPGITVEYLGADNDDVYNGKYYNTDRTAIIRIEEANFFEADVADGLLVITRAKTMNNGTYVEEILTPEFTKDGDVYTAEILFNEDADYTFDIKYTDRSGNEYDSYPMDVFTIDKIKPIIEVSYDNNTCVNENQFKEARSATIKVTEHNFIEEGVIAKVNNVEYQLTWMPVEGEVDVYETEVSFPGDAHYTFEVSGVDLANNANNGVDTSDSVAPWVFTVDSSGPQELKVTYEPTFIATVLEGITFGFYKAPVKVTIEASDDISGIDFFTYTYAVQEGASTINVGAKDVKVDVNGTTASTSFEIPAQFRGCVSFVATNNSGVSASYAEEKVAVVDTIAPGITVEYDNKNAKNDKYYDADRTATIKISEANFFAQDIEDGLLVITVGKTDNSGTYTETIEKPTFIKDGDVYTAKVKFDENADYTFDIKYTDRAGNVYDSYKMDEFTIDKIQPQISIEEGNGAYYNDDRTVKLTVVEHNFRASDYIFAAEAKDVTGQKIIDLTAKGYTAYLQNPVNWTETAADTWEAEITFDIEGNYVVGATYSDLSGNHQVSAISDTFCIDKSDPENLTITYEPSFIGTVLETITFGFYKAPVTVKIEAMDEYAGIDYFVYSYAVEADASDVNSGMNNVTVAATPVTGTNEAWASFEIPAQFRGNVSFTAYDKATNSSYKADANVVVVDDMAPAIKVAYDNNNSVYDNYYNADRTATITITEANFFGNEQWEYADYEDDLLIITVEKTLNDGTYTSTKMKPEFTKNGDVYTATILFDENADYTFDITYTDRSGNVYDSYEMDSFTIDKIDPVIEVSYDNNTCKNENQFKADREATIVITEHNFKASDVVAQIKANGTEATSYAEFLTNDANWVHNGDVHTAKILYTEEAHYTFEINYSDMAGNTNEGVDYGTSVAATVFTLDKTAPTELDIKIDETSVAGSMETLVFNKFYDAAVSVKLSANCDISGLESFKYQKVASISEYDEDGTWTDYNAETGIVVSPSEKFIIYFRAEDRAGNVSIIRSTGIVVDNQKPIGETKAPEIDILPDGPNENNLYRGNVNVGLKVVDPKYTGAEATVNGHYSGLNKVTYRIYTTDTSAVNEGTLLDVTNGVTGGAVYDDDKLINSWSGSIVIDSAVFNSNNVIVEITATDNAGNSRTSTTQAGEIRIDVTAPVINISYNNNEVDSERIFKADRIATIVITERNFKPEDVQISLTNTDGVIPTLSDWSRSGGSGNQDDTNWSATITYSADGDYEFGISYTDMAGNACASISYGNDIAPTAFTIDKTIPVITVNYDNQNVKNGNYYKDDRTATIVITEHNFSADRVSISLAATDDGAATALPSISRWITNGDKHTATIYYGNDAKYTFDIAMSDMAGNVSVEYTEETFFVDKTAPTLTITGVENNSANNGDVIPVVSYFDTNYDANQVSITLSGANRKDVKLDGTYGNIHNGRTFTFNNFAVEKEIDDIYTLTATLIDKAGNESTETIIFSVNRFGSTYAMSESTEVLNGTYVQKPIDVVITEINADELTNIKITLFKNNETIVLTEGEDYRIDVEGGNGQWYQYTYTVFAENFEDDGVYRLTFHSEDSAGNVAENTLDTKETEISFGVDKTKPNIVVANLESGVTYALENLSVEMSANDNLMLTSVAIYLDDYNNAYKTWTNEELAAIIAENGEFIFDIAGNSKGAHKLKIVCVDAAGNEQIEEITDFYVTTDIFVRYYNNKPLFFGSIAGVILIAGLIVFLVAYKKKKNEADK